MHLGNEFSVDVMSQTTVTNCQKQNAYVRIVTLPVGKPSTLYKSLTRPIFAKHNNTKRSKIYQYNLIIRLS